MRRRRGRGRGGRRGGGGYRCDGEGEGERRTTANCKDTPQRCAALSRCPCLRVALTTVPGCCGSLAGSGRMSAHASDSESEATRQQGRHAALLEASATEVHDTHSTRHSENTATEASRQETATPATGQRTWENAQRRYTANKLCAVGQVTPFLAWRIPRDHSARHRKVVTGASARPVLCSPNIVTMRSQRSGEVPL